MGGQRGGISGVRLLSLKMGPFLADRSPALTVMT